MIDVAEHFFLLEAGNRRATGTQLLTRPAGVEVAGRQTLVAIDSARQKHLLIPVAVDEFEEDNTSQGVTLALESCKWAAATSLTRTCTAA